MYYYPRFSLQHYDLEAFPGPRPGEPLVDCELTAADGRPVRLSDYRGRWLVIETGSLTCNMYARNVATMARLRERHPDVAFVLVYVREAHPGRRTPQHRSLQDKQACARQLGEVVGETREVLLDDMQGSFHRAYGAMPNMVYVVDPAGTVVYRHDWTVPAELERVLATREPGHVVPGEHAYTADLKAFGPKTNYWMFRTVARGGLDALWDLVKVLPLFLVEHLRVDRHYRQRESAPADARGLGDGAQGS